MPSCPALLSPQLYTVPVVARAQLWASPQLISATGTSLGGGGGGEGGGREGGREGKGGGREREGGREEGGREWGRGEGERGRTVSQWNPSLRPPLT